MIFFLAVGRALFFFLRYRARKKKSINCVEKRRISRTLFWRRLRTHGIFSFLFIPMQRTPKKKMHTACSKKKYIQFMPDTCNISGRDAVGIRTKQINPYG